MIYLFAIAAGAPSRIDVLRLALHLFNFLANAFQLLNVMFGALSLAFGQVCNYWLCPSAGSKRSSDSIRKIAEAK